MAKKTDFIPLYCPHELVPLDTTTGKPVAYSSRPLYVTNINHASFDLPNPTDRLVTCRPGYPKIWRYQRDGLEYVCCGKDPEVTGFGKPKLPIAKRAAARIVAVAKRRSDIKRKCDAAKISYDQAVSKLTAPQLMQRTKITSYFTIPVKGLLEELHLRCLAYPPQDFKESRLREIISKELPSDSYIARSAERTTKLVSGRNGEIIRTFLDKYTDDVGYKLMNGFLRNRGTIDEGLFQYMALRQDWLRPYLDGPPKDGEVFATLEEFTRYFITQIHLLIDASPRVETPFVVYRGQGSLGRVLSSKKNQLYKSTGFLSTSISGIKSLGFVSMHDGVLFRIIVPPGSRLLYMEPITVFKEEYELLIDHNATFAVAGPVVSREYNMKRFGEVTLVLVQSTPPSSRASVPIVAPEYRHTWSDIVKGNYKHPPPMTFAGPAPMVVAPPKHKPKPGPAPFMPGPAPFMPGPAPFMPGPAPPPPGYQFKPPLPQLAVPPGYAPPPPGYQFKPPLPQPAVLPGYAPPPSGYQFKPPLPQPAVPPGYAPPPPGYQFKPPPVQPVYHPQPLPPPGYQFKPPVGYAPGYQSQPTSKLPAPGGISRRLPNNYTTSLCCIQLCLGNVSKFNAGNKKSLRKWALDSRVHRPQTFNSRNSRFCRTCPRSVLVRGARTSTTSELMLATVIYPTVSQSNKPMPWMVNVSLTTELKH